MKKTFIADIRERDWVDTPFLVRDKIMAMAKNGKPYMTLKLVDRTGEVEGRVWDRVDDFAGRFERDDFIRVQGKASVYMGKMQLVIQELKSVRESEVDLADFLPICSRSTNDLQAELREKVDSLRDAHLRQLLQLFLADPKFLHCYSTAPAAKAMHHVYLGGLLEHSLAVAGLAEDICVRYAGLNRDLLIVGALLHDVGKVAELSYERTFDYTDEGKLIGHIVMGVEMVEEQIRQIPGFPRPLAIHLKHLLLSHHGQYEYGSPKRPKTLEAVILNFLDDIDSKINGVRTHIDKEPDSASAWTAYHRLYDRYFFKGERTGEPAQVQSEGPELPADPVPAPPTAVLPAATAAKPPREERRDERKKGFGFTLGDQLRGKSLDLFTLDDDSE
ncbi:MAG: HD domain-containing protein [Desulfuromonadales bacterium]|nr:HD domain-containing protein [Desulfuromonadales bacterium]